MQARKDPSTAIGAWGIHDWSVPYVRSLLVLAEATAEEKLGAIALL
jgi:hypothetical protein